MNLESLINGIQLDNPRLYQILMELNRQVTELDNQLNPLVAAAALPPASPIELEPPEGFTFIFTPTTVRFTWDNVSGAVGYEVRKTILSGEWDTATFQFRTPSLQADIDPLLIGSYEFLIKSIASDGTYSERASATFVDVPQPGAVVITSQVIDNNVLLDWDEPISVFRILNYEIAKGGVVVGFVDASFFTRFENVAGSYTYRIVAIDIAGNRGVPSEVTVEVLSPPDYALQDERISDLSGTRVNLALTDIPSLIFSNITETWEDHFINNSWNTIEDQINAGYPIYIQPTNLTGSYEEVIDYGLVLNNVIATITFNFNLIDPDVATVIQMATSLDGAAWSSFTPGASQFIPTMRYLKFRLEFTGTDDHSVMEVFNVTILLNVKRENDGGEILADETDVGGTEVLFNKAFKDIESITCTTKSVTEPYYVIFDFTDIPNPVSFFVYVFDSTGNRVTKIIDWKARGII